MDEQELLERYEALGKEDDFVAAKRLFERELVDSADARLHNDYGYLLECHARNELRRALGHYEEAIRLDPGYDKPHFQLISARAGLQEPELAVALYEQRLASAPDEPRGHRFLASAYLRAHAYEQALAVAEAGLGLAPDDARLLALRGEARAGLGDPERALADWGRAVEVDRQDIGALYSSAFLLEREGRLEEALAMWRTIIAWHGSRGHTLQTEWPVREAERLQAALEA